MSARDRIVELDAITRLRTRDASLFSSDPDEQRDVEANLGWTELAAEAKGALPLLDEIVADARVEGYSDVVLLGMGGSSLATLVTGSVVQGDPGVRLHVLDTTSPVTVRHTLEGTYPATTIHVVASKSGTTIEPLSHYAVFRRAADEALGRDAAGSRFIAITDPGTPLEAQAHAEGFRAVVSAPATVGGRYSALSVFGLLPALLVGIDLHAVLHRAQAMEQACTRPFEDNPAAQLAAFAVDAHGRGRDKLTLVASPGMETFGLWVEQLVAESLGKEGTGIVPVVDLSEDKPAHLGDDCAVVAIRLDDDERLAQWVQGWRQDIPVHEVVLRDARDVGAEFVRWEHAVALMGPLLGVNPFGQPNVAAAKAATARVLDGGSSLADPPSRDVDVVVGEAIASMRTNDYLAILAYLPDDATTLAPLTSLVPGLSQELRAAVTLELGPRYLHSTGQLHKGGPDIGVFLLVTTADRRDVEVPGKPWGLRTLHGAQAVGDFLTLSDAGRRVFRAELADATPQSVRRLAQALAREAGVIIEGHEGR